MSEHRIHWNAASDEWLCLLCLRASDAISKEDAEHELSRFDCLSTSDNQTKPVVDERRETARKKTFVQAEILLRGRTVPIRVTTADLSLGGCYIENMFTLSIGAHLEIGLWIGEQKLKISSVVKTCDPVFGNGIQFVEIQPADKAKLAGYLRTTSDS